MGATIRDLLLLTLRSPRKGTQGFMQLKLAEGELYAMALLVCIVASIGTYLQFVLITSQANVSTVLGITYTPFSMALFNLGSFVVLLLLTLLLGRLFGGTGTFVQTLKGLTWLQFIGLIMQFFVLFSELVIPILSSTLSAIAIVYYTVLYCKVVSVIHGFKSALLVFLAIIFLFMIVFLALSSLLVGYLPDVSPV